MANIVRYSSKQGELDIGADGTKKLLDFTIPENSGVYDLSKAYIDLSIRGIFADASGAVHNSVSGDSVGVFAGTAEIQEGQPAAADAANRLTYTTAVNKTGAVLVKNVEMVSSLRGRVAACRNVRVIRGNLSAYSSSEEDRRDETTSLGGSRQTINQFELGNLAELNGIGSVPSQQKNLGVKIYLKDLVNFGKVRNYDSAKMGRLDIHIETEMCEENGGRIAYRANFNATGPNANEAGSPWTERQKLEATLPLMSALDNIPAAPVPGGQTLDVTSVQTSAKYTSVKDSPFWVSQKVRVIGGAAVVAGAFTRVHKILSIVHNDGSQTVAGDKGKLILNLDTTNVNIQLAATEQYSVCSIQSVVPPTVTFACDSQDLVCSVVDGSGADSLDYSEYHLVEDNIAAGTNQIQRSYQIPPNTINCVVMFPSPIYSHDFVSTYRVAINNESLSTRDVEYGSAEHIDMLRKSAMNRGEQLKDNNEQLQTDNQRQGQAGSYLDVKSIQFPVPLSSAIQLLDLEVTLTAGRTFTGRMNMFFEQVKSL